MIPVGWYPGMRNARDFLGKHRCTQSMKPTLHISRSMTETSSLRANPYFPRGFHRKIDQIWAPASFLLDVFRTGGVPKRKVRVLHETVDLVVYDPYRRVGVPEDLEGLRGDLWMDWKRGLLESRIEKTVNDYIEIGSVDIRDRGSKDGVKSSAITIPVQQVSSKYESNLLSPPPSLESERFNQPEDSPCRFLFLSIFKWEPRKDPDTLLRAIFQTFGVDSGVCLLLSTRGFGRDVDKVQERNSSA
jgi:hypothetical protein